MMMNVAVAVNCALEIGGCSFVKQLQDGVGDGEVCGYSCCKFSRNTVRQQRHIVQQTCERQASSYYYYYYYN